MSAEQKAMLKNLAILAAFYFGIKAKSSFVRYAVMSALAYVIVKGYSASPDGSGVAGMGMKIDPHMAIDMMFPEMSDQKKGYAKLACSELMRGLFPVHRGIQVGRL